jgi:hypothetical protein
LSGFWHESGNQARVTGQKTPAIAYLRISSAANVGADKDSEERQRAAITGFANANGYEIETEFHDAAVCGGIDPGDDPAAVMDTSAQDRTPGKGSFPMRAISASLFVALLWLGQVTPVRAGFLDGNELYQDCQQASQSCAAYIVGIADALSAGATIYVSGLAFATI